MRIAQLTKYFHPHKGGIESNVLGIAKGLIERGNKVSIFTSNVPKGKKYEILDGAEIHRAENLFTIFNDPFTPGIIIGLLKEDYDLIHLHLPDPFNSIFAFVASVLRKKPLVITYHADIIKDRWYHKPFKFIYNFFLYFVLRQSKRIIATTPNYAESSDTLRKFRDKIVVVPNFVDTGKFHPELDGGKIRKLHGLGNKRVILFLGRLVPYKGVEYLIKAFSDIKKEFDNSALIIVGEGPLKNELGNLAKGTDDIYFVDANDKDIPLYYASCDLFVLPSVTRQEAFGIALLEAMACGKPVVTTNISGMPYVVGDAGIAVNPRDIVGLKGAIIRILSNGKISKKLGEKARKRVLDKFTYKKFMENILKVYENVLSA